MSVLDRAWDHVARATPIVVVNSPPGAGKTTLAVRLIRQARLNTDWVIKVVCPTNRGGGDIASRLANAIPPGSDGKLLVQAVSGNIPLGASVAGGNDQGASRRAVQVSTVAAAARSKTDSKIDLLVVDEAYQCLLGDVLACAAGTPQILLIGDPGQIGPVVTVPTTAWDNLPVGPHMRAPEGILAHASTLDIPTAVLSLDTSYRLGGRTVRTIAPLYDFAFDSSRPDRWVERRGRRLPEIAPVALPAVSDPYSGDIALRIARRVRGLIEGTLHGPKGIRQVRQSDVAVVVSHVAQRTLARTTLQSQGLGRVNVGTADELQGGQWPAVVALDPLVGYEAATAHSLGSGRLCVMISRHMAHLSWIFSPNWADAIEESGLDPEEANKGWRVRTRLLRHTNP